MSFVVFFAGKIGAGKDLAANYLKQLAQEDNLQVDEISFSLILRSLLSQLHLPLSRENYQKLVLALEQVFPGQLLHSATERLQLSRADLVVFTGLCWRRHRKILTVLPSRLVYVEANQKIRYQRLPRQEDKVGQSSISFREFQALDRSETECEIESYRPLANAIVVNDLGRANLKAQIDRVYSTVRWQLVNK